MFRATRARNSLLVSRSLRAFRPPGRAFFLSPTLSEVGARNHPNPDHHPALQVFAYRPQRARVCVGCLFTWQSL